MFDLDAKQRTALRDWSVAQNAKVRESGGTYGCGGMGVFIIFEPSGVGTGVYAVNWVTGDFISIGYGDSGEFGADEQMTLEELRQFPVGHMIASLQPPSPWSARPAAAT